MSGYERAQAEQVDCRRAANHFRCDGTVLLSERQFEGSRHTLLVSHSRRVLSASVVLPKIQTCIGASLAPQALTDAEKPASKDGHDHTSQVRLLVLFWDVC